MARARGEVHGFTVPAINIRAQTFDMARTVYETAAAADVGAVILELARSEQTYTFQRPIDYATAVLAGAIAAGWRGPVFLQGDHYQFNMKKYAGRPRGDDRGDPAGLPARDRRRLPEHRHRQLDPRRPVEADPRRAAARELRPGGRADRPHPLARDRRRDGQRRRRDRRGRQGELERGGARRLPRRLPPRARARARRARSGSARSASRPGRRTAACRCPTAPSRRSSSTSTSSAGSARSPARTGSPARSSTARRPCPTSCSIGSRRSRRPRSTSRPGFQNALFEHPAFPAELHREIEAWCFANAARRAQARPDRPAVRLHDAQEGDRAVQAPALGPADEGRDPRGPAPQDRRSCSPSSA